jgi:hypothetical protein
MRAAHYYYWPGQRRAAGDPGDPTPQSLYGSDLWGWWEADSYTGGAGAWVGEGPSPKTLTVGRTGTKTTSNGLPLAVFSGAGTVSVVAALPQPFTVMMALRTPNASDPGAVAIWSADSSARVMVRTAGIWFTQFGNFLSAVIDGGQYAQDTPAIGTWVVNGASSNSRKNGVSVASGTATLIDGDRFELNGDQYASVTADVGYSSIIVVAKALSLSDIQAGEAYLVTRSGVSL